MKVLLLIPPTDLSKSYGQLKDFSNPQPSIGIAYIASVLCDNGHTVKVLDAYVDGCSMQELMRVIREENPDVIGISVLTPSAEVVQEISTRIKESLPEIILVMGNLHASLFADELLTSETADVVVHREGEWSFLELLEAIESGRNFEEVHGISFKKNGAIINTPLRAVIEDLDGLPFPAWDMFPMHKYSTDPRTAVKKGFVEMQILGTRGCPNQCTFCSSRTEKSLGAKYRMRDPKAIVDEMVYMYEKYGSRVFTFMDLAFPLVKRHAMAFCDEIIHRGLHRKFKWVTECRVKPLDLELLMLMKEAGCVRINFGIESGNDETLKRLRKNFKAEDISEAVRMAKKAGLEVDGMFMMGLPGETEAMIRQTINFALELNLRYAIFNIFVPYPGCELYDTLMAENKIHFKNWSDFTSYPTYAGGRPVYVPDDLTYQKLMDLQKYAMRKFYLRPRFVFQELRRMKLSKIKEYYHGLKEILS